jgi:hypothetical protein
LILEFPGGSEFGSEIFPVCGQFGTAWRQFALQFQCAACQVEHSLANRRREFLLAGQGISAVRAGNSPAPMALKGNQSNYRASFAFVLMADTLKHEFDRPDS